MQPAHNHKVPRDRLKGYTTRPLPSRRARPLTMDVVSSSSNKKYVVSASTGKPLRVVNARAVKPTKVPIAIKHKVPRFHGKRTVVTSLTLVVTIVALYANFNLITTNPGLGTAAVAENSSVTQGESETTNSVRDVDETEPDITRIREYKVSADLPRFLKIDKLKINSRVMRVGVDANNEILTPKNVFNVGWYEGSSKPGEPGAIFINGHVSGPSKKGIFYNLKKLNEGDIIKIETGDSNLIEYKVVAKEVVPANEVDMNKVLRSYDVDKQGLNLMTCSGEFVSDSDTFDKRQIIYSVRI